MPSTKLSDKFIADQKPCNKLLIFRDTKVIGLSLRIYPSGRKVFYFRCRSKFDGGYKIHEPKIGSADCITVSAARNIARDWHSKIRLGLEPEFMQHSSSETTTMSDLFSIYLKQYARKRKKPSSVRHDERMIQKNLNPEFGRIAVSRITRAMVRSYHLSLADKPYEANRRVALLSKVFSFAAEELSLINDEQNPARNIRKFSEKKRRRYLSGDELRRLGATLQLAETGKFNRAFSLYALATIRLLLLTGARQGEILGLRWDEVNFQRPCLELKDSKTGVKDVYLPSEAVKILTELPKVEGNPYVMVGQLPGKHLVNVKDTWRYIRKKSNLDDVRLHDLRHTYASIAVQSGISLPIIGAILGHQSTLTTSRYAHLSNAPTFEAGAKVSQIISTQMG